MRIEQCSSFLDFGALRLTRSNVCDYSHFIVAPPSLVGSLVGCSSAIEFERPVATIKAAAFR